MSNKILKIFLVIPTIRDLRFLKSWKNKFSQCHLIVIEDKNDCDVEVSSQKFASVNIYTRSDIKKEFGSNSWIFSRKNAGIRTYGFYKAHKLGADIIITIDDDCYPTGDDLVQGHLDNLNFKAPEKWINTYPNPSWIYTRGIPYKVRDKVKICISHGLWSGALDLDGRVESKLPKLLEEKKYPPIRQIIPFNYYYPMCSMNLAFSREITPIMFFPMMGKKPDGTPWSYDRYDDIWAGIFSKKIMDHLGLGVVNGSPFVNHKKVSKARENHKKELTGASINEKLWKLVDEVKLTKDTPKDCYIELAKKIKFPDNKYFIQLKKAMLIWAKLF